MRAKLYFLFIVILISYKHKTMQNETKIKKPKHIILLFIKTLHHQLFLNFHFQINFIYLDQVHFLKFFCNCYMEQRHLLIFVNLRLMLIVYLFLDINTLINEYIVFFNLIFLLLAMLIIYFQLNYK